MSEPLPSDRLAEIWKRHAAAIDLDKLRVVVKRWAPRVAAATLGAVAGVSLATFTVRAVTGFAADKSGTVMAVSAVLAIASANVTAWWMWGRGKVAEVREERENGNSWRNWALDFARVVAGLREENARLAAEVARLTPGAVVARLHERMGDRP